MHESDRAACGRDGRLCCKSCSVNVTDASQTNGHALPVPDYQPMGFIERKKTTAVPRDMVTARERSRTIVSGEMRSFVASIIIHKVSRIAVVGVTFIEQSLYDHIKRTVRNNCDILYILT